MAGIIAGRVGIGLLAVAFVAACGDDEARPPSDVAEAAEADVAEASDGDAVADAVEDAVAETDAAEETSGAETADAATEVALDVSSEEVVIDRNCQFDPRLANGRSSDRRCAACRSALGALRVRAELMWSGRYVAAESAGEVCTLFPDRACKAGIVEAEALLCADLDDDDEERVVWSDLAIAVVGEGAEATEHEVRGPLYGIRLAEVWRASPSEPLPPEEAFDPATWRVGPAGEQVSATLRESPREDDCPVKRFTIAGLDGDIGPCQLAVALLGKAP